MTETGWLIEINHHKQTKWLTMCLSEYNEVIWDWTIDNSKGMRFSRKEDALKFIAYLGVRLGIYKATEHAWEVA